MGNVGQRIYDELPEFSVADTAIDVASPCFCSHNCKAGECKLLRSPMEDYSFGTAEQPKIPCMHEALDRECPEMKGQPRGLSCPCPKCTPYC